MNKGKKIENSDIIYKFIMRVKEVNVLNLTDQCENIHTHRYDCFGSSN